MNDKWGCPLGPPPSRASNTPSAFPAHPPVESMDGKPLVPDERRRWKFPRTDGYSGHFGGGVLHGRFILERHRVKESWSHGNAVVMCWPSRRGQWKGGSGMCCLPEESGNWDMEKKTLTTFRPNVLRSPRGKESSLMWCNREWRRYKYLGERLGEHVKEELDHTRVVWKK